MCMIDSQWCRDSWLEYDRLAHLPDGGEKGVSVMPVYHFHTGSSKPEQVGDYTLCFHTIIIIIIIIGIYKAPLPKVCPRALYK